MTGKTGVPEGAFLAGVDAGRASLQRLVMHDALEGFDVDLARLERRVIEYCGLHFGGNGRIVDVLPGAFLCGRGGAPGCRQQRRGSARPLPPKDRSMRLQVLCLPLFLAGCSCLQGIENPAAVRTAAAAPVGGTVYSEATYWSKTGHRLLDSLQTGLGPGRVAVTAGDLVFKGNVNGRMAYCTEQPGYLEASAGPGKTACRAGKRGVRYAPAPAPPGPLRRRRPCRSRS